MYPPEDDPREDDPENPVFPLVWEASNSAIFWAGSGRPKELPPEDEPEEKLRDGADEPPLL